MKNEWRTWKYGAASEQARGQGEREGANNDEYGELEEQASEQKSMRERFIEGERGRERDSLVKRQANKCKAREEERAWKH